MKELKINIKEKTELRAEAKQESKQKYLGTILPKKGHTLFEVNTITGEIKKAKYEKTDIDFEKAKEGIIVKKRKVIIKPNCIYVSALNIKNVIKKLKKLQ